MTWLRLALHRPTILRSAAVAAVIGTVLNLINQGDAIFGPAPVAPVKLVLTYLVPYCVATYGAVSALANAKRSGPPLQHREGADDDPCAGH